MKTIVMMLMGLVVCAPFSAQTHAVTVEQCRADLKFWSTPSGGYGFEVNVDSPYMTWPFQRLMDASTEMAQCATYDHAREDRHGFTYESLSDYLKGLAFDRVLGYVTAHQWGQFLEWDDALTSKAKKHEGKK